MDFAGECEHYAIVPVPRATAIMGFKQITQTPVGADLSRTPPIMKFNKLTGIQ